MKTQSKAGGISAIIAAATYIFAIGLAGTVLSPMTDLSLGFKEYMTFLTANQTLIFIWHFAMYIINGVCLVFLALSLYDRLKDGAPMLARAATVFGFLWIALVFASGLITNYGTSALVNLYAVDPSRAESLKLALETITLGIDSSDKLLGCLWVGLSSLAAFKIRALPRAAAILGMLISVIGLLGSTVPALIAISYAFGVGVIVWWLWIGIALLRVPSPRPVTILAASHS
jgi:hypothetical protein